jgi:hypothetical protein
VSCRGSGLLTLTAIDELGGVSDDMTDDQEEDAEKEGVAYLYLIFGIITAFSLMFIVFKVPETKGKTPEQLRGIDQPKGLMYSDDALVNSPLINHHNISV